MTLPNFLVIGAGKAGTTSVYRYLKQHPQVFMSFIKETNFFAYICAGWDDRELKRLGWSASFPVRTLEAYEALFEPARDEKAVGEISPRYLAIGRPAAECIRRHLRGVRLIAILRNPIDRAYSSYLSHTRDGRERRTFERAIEEERAGVQRERMDFGQLHYVGLGRYYEGLKPYFDLFPREQIQVHLFEGLQRDPAAMMRSIFHFLEVDEEHVPDLNRRYNVSGIQKSALLRLLLRERPMTSRARRMLPKRLQDEVAVLLEYVRTRGLERPEMRPETRSWLAAQYRDDNEKLAQLIGRDLSAWLS